ncbi:hypothetical protein ACM614_05080, partial [Streptomyces sp. 12297]
MSTEPALTDLSAAVLATGGELRAGGTDTTARQRSGVSPGPFTDLGGAGHLRGTSPLPGGGEVGEGGLGAHVASPSRSRSGRMGMS